MYKRAKDKHKPTYSQRKGLKWSERKMNKTYNLMEIEGKASKEGSLITRAGKQAYVTERGALEDILRYLKMIRELLR